MTEPASPEFIAEAQEIVDNLNTSLIAAEAKARLGEDAIEPALLNELFRNAHSLKGISGMFGFEQMGRLAHGLESAFDGMRMGRLKINAETLDALFQSIETFNTLVHNAAEGLDFDATLLNTVVQQLEALGKDDTEEEPEDALLKSGLKEDVLAVLTEYEEHRLRENLRKGHGLYLLRTSFDLSSFDVGLAELDNVLTGEGEVVTKLPSSEATDPDRISFDIIVGSPRSAEELSSKIHDDRVSLSTITPGRLIVGAASAADTAGPEREVRSLAESQPQSMSERGVTESESVRSVAQTVRVDIRRLDRLMNLVGELALIRMNLESLSETISRNSGFGGVNADLQKVSRDFERRLAEMQSGIMDVRMVPLANLFERMIRVGRKIGRELKREVRIELEGESTELDKLIVEELAEPLMHLIRNSIDHGVEQPEERLRAGKPSEALVRLTASAIGNHVIVTISDDGRGIDIEEVKGAAVKRGLLSATEVKDLTRFEVYNLLFTPGFSTKSEVSEFSGRGVGMDVVKTNINKLSGIIEIRSTKGEGTTFTITLPITLAIIPALVVSVSDNTYAVPLNNVLETVHIAPDEYSTIDRREVIAVRGLTLPLVDLRDVFQLEGTRPDDFFAVVVGVGETRMAMVVDDLVGNQDIVIKSLGEHLRRVPGVAGATDLGTQETILVIDTVELLNEAASGQLHRRQADHV